MVETRIQTAKRHVAEQEALIAKQRRILKALNEAGEPTKAAQQLLETMETALAVYKAELTRLCRR